MAIMIQPIIDKSAIALDIITERPTELTLVHNQLVAQWQLDKTLKLYSRWAESIANLDKSKN